MFNYSPCTNVCVHVYVDTSQRMMNVIHICVDYGEVGLGIGSVCVGGGGGGCVCPGPCSHLMIGVDTYPHAPL